MSLNSIKFETTDIARLFKNSLVEIDEKKQVSSNPESVSSRTNDDTASAGWKYLGENKKNTLIVVRYADAVHIPDKQLSFLTKLLAACNLNLGDVAILNFHDHQPTQFNEILDYFKPKIVLMFDVNPAEFGMPMNFPHYQLQAFTHATFLYAPSLAGLENDKLQKSKLWVCLKRLFNL